MPKRRLILGTISLGACAVALCLTHACTGEPSFKGRSLSTWLARLDVAVDETGATQTQNAEALEAVRHMGTNTVPFLLRYIHSEGPPKPAKAILMVHLFLEGHGLHWDLTGMTKAHRAQLALCALGSEARVAIPTLVRLSSDTTAPNTAYRAAWVLISIATKEDLPALAQVFTNQQESARWIVANHIHRLGPDARPAIPLLLHCLQHTNSDIAAAAALSIGKLHLEPQQCVPALVATLAAGDDATRFRSATALGEFETDATFAVPALRKMLRDPSPHVATAASNALRSITPSNPH
jgi:hypothetical protein